MTNLNRTFFGFTLLFVLFSGTIFSFAAAQTFPVTISHKYGDTTIETEPQRIITLGYNDQDALYAVGKQPVAVRHWFGEHDHDVFPWAIDAAGDASPDLLGVGELDFETILNYSPDLIVGQFVGLSQAEYDRLSQIAPTVAQAADYSDYETPWQEMTTIIGKAVGRQATATAAVRSVEEKIEAAKKEHSEFANKEIVVALPNPDGGYWIYAANDNRGRMMEAMGFKIPEVINKEAGDKGYVDASAERLDLLEADVLVIVESAEHPVPNLKDWLEDPLFKALDVVKDGRMIHLKGNVADALVFNTVLSIPYALKAIVPMIEEIFE